MKRGVCKSSMACVFVSLVVMMISVMRTNDREITRTWISKMEQWSLKEQHAEEVSIASHTVLERNHYSHRQIWRGGSIASPSCAYMISRETKQGIAERAYHIETIKHLAHIPYRGIPSYSDPPTWNGPHDICDFPRKRMG